MTSNRCAHKDLRVFDDTMCCLSCGMIREFAPEKALPENASTSKVGHEELDWKPYKYRSLSRDRDEIRLLTLLPGKPLGWTQKPSREVLKNSRKPRALYFQLTTVELDSAPPYVAVSYTWATETGDAALSRRIFVHADNDPMDESVIKVTVNCEDALQQLWNPSVAQVIWIDAICIDQNRISERNHQVSMMDRIYKRATRVHVCIPNTTEDYQALMLLFLRESPLSETTLNGYGDQEIEKWPEFAQIEALFNLRYFSRVWVFQEVMLARAAFLHVNDHMAAFPEKTIRRIHKLYSMRNRSNINLSRWANLLRRDSSIVSCLHTSLNSSATDPRDKVFAITGLLRSQTRAMISIDYMLSIEDVLRQAVTACIMERGNLDIICYAGLPNEADLSTTSAFDIEQLKYFLADKSREKDDIIIDPHKAKVETEWAHDFSCVPSAQLLPRLKVRAKYVCLCGERPSYGVGESPAIFTSDIKLLHTTHWSWLLGSQFAYGDKVAAHAVEGLEALQDTKGVLAGSHSSLPSDPYVFRARDCFGVTNGHCVIGDAIFFISGARWPFLLRKVEQDVYRIVGACGIWVSDILSSEDSKRRTASFTASPPASWALLENDFSDTSEKQCIEIY